MNKKFVRMPGILPLSKAILFEGKSFLEISGQIGTDSTGKLVEGIEAQTEATFQNIKKILDEVKWSFGDIVKVRVYLSDMNNYSKMNEIYSKYFTKNYPTRIALGVGELPLDALVEIECIASKN